MGTKVELPSGRNALQISTTSTSPVFAGLPNDIVAIILSHLSKLNEIHPLLLTDWQFNRCVSSDDNLWKRLANGYFPNTVPENISNYKDAFKLLISRDANINDYKFRTCSLNDHKKAVTDLKIQGDKFASCSFDGTVILRNLNTREILFKWDLRDHGGCHSLAMQDDAIFVGSNDGTISTLNAATKEKDVWKDRHEEGRISLAVQGNKLISANNIGSYVSSPVRIWDHTKKELDIEFRHLIYSVAVLGNKVFVGSDKLIMEYPLNGGKRQNDWGAPNNAVHDLQHCWQGHNIAVHGLTVQGDRLFSCTGYGDIKSWDTNNRNKLVHDFQTCGQLLREETSKLVVQEDKIFCVLDGIAVLDLKNGETLYVMKSESATTSACMQNGFFISGSEDGTITIRDYNFPSVTSYDEQTLENNLVVLDKITEKDDSLCKELHPKFAARLQELKNKPLPFNEAVLRVKIEVCLHLLLDRIHRGDQKRISELLEHPIWNELFLIDIQTKQLYENIIKACKQEPKKIDPNAPSRPSMRFKPDPTKLDLSGATRQQKNNSSLSPLAPLKEQALKALKTAEQAVLKFLQHQKKC